MTTCRFIKDNAFVNLVSSKWAVSNTAVQLKLKRNKLSTVFGVITGHVRRIGLGYHMSDFCRSCGDEKEDRTISR